MECDNKFRVDLDKPKIDHVNGGLIHYIMVGCGKCYSCKQRRAAQWSYRIAKEVERSQSAYFVTLTYAVPPYKGRNPTLLKSHVQDFLKRLRKADKNPKRTSLDALESAKKGIIRKPMKIKYFAAGEYGEKNGTPHYHLIIINLQDQSSINEAWNEGTGYRVNKEGKEGVKILDSYVCGNVDIQEVNINTIDYVVKYISKDPSEKVKKLKINKEFNIQSKNLGVSLLDGKGVKKFFRRNPEINYVVTDRGHKIALSKYYRDKIYKCDDEQLSEITGEKIRCGQCEACITRDVSISHIKTQIEKKRNEEEEQAKKDGLNIDHIRQQQKVNRRNLLNRNYKKRD